MAIRRTAWPAGVPCWTDLAVPDVRRAGAFYAAVLGWEVGEPAEGSGGYVVATVHGEAVAGIGPVVREGPAAWTLYFASDDADATAAEVAAHGGTILLPPGDAGPQGRMFVALDPTGAPFGVWQAGERIGAALTSAPGGLTWEDLRTTDPAAARAFYAAVFGFGSTDLGPGVPGYELFTLPGHTGPLGGIGPFFAEPVAPHWLVYFGVRDVEAAMAAARVAGGAVAQEHFESPYGRMAGLTDPDGALFWVVETTDDNEGSGLPERTA